MPCPYSTQGTNALSATCSAVLVCMMLQTQYVPAHYACAAGYHIPRGGLFEYVSAANYSAEILEWSGYALAAWRLPAAAFAWFTFCNLAPRGLAHHQWYLQKFGKKYPRQRKAVIPFIW